MLIFHKIFHIIKACEIEASSIQVPQRTLSEEYKVNHLASRKNEEKNFGLKLNLRCLKQTALPF